MPPRFPNGPGDGPGDGPGGGSARTGPALGIDLSADWALSPHDQPVPASLHRPPPGRLAPLSARAAGLVDSWTREVRADTDHLRVLLRSRGRRAPAVPPLWRMPTSMVLGDVVDVDPRQPLGPLHWLVAARAEQLVIADPPILAEFATRAAAASATGMTPAAVGTMLSAQARSCGRELSVRQAFDAGQPVLEAITGRSRATGRWREACRLLGAPASGPGRRRFELECQQGVRGWVTTTLATEVLADVLPAGSLGCGRGPWAWAIHPEAAPGPPWIAAREVVDQVAGWIQALTPDQLGGLTDRFQRVSRGPDLQVVTGLLHGFCTTGPGSPPPGVTLLPDPVARSVPDGVGFACEQIGLLLVAGLSFRHRLTPSAWSALAEPVRPWFPLP